MPVAYDVGGGGSFKYSFLCIKKKKTGNGQSLAPFQTIFFEYNSYGDKLRLLE